MKNNLMDLANILFDEIGALDDIETKDSKKMKQEIEKAKAKLALAEGIIEIGKVQLEAQRYLGGYRKQKDEIIPELITPKKTDEFKPLLETK